jgi:hypothetical protein
MTYNFPTNFYYKFNSFSNVTIAWGKAVSNTGYKVIRSFDYTTFYTSETNLSLDLITTKASTFTVRPYNYSNSTKDGLGPLVIELPAPPTGWTLQTNGGLSNTPCLRCANVPYYSNQVVYFSEPGVILTAPKRVSFNWTGNGFIGNTETVSLTVTLTLSEFFKIDVA